MKIVIELSDARLRAWETALVDRNGLLGTENEEVEVKDAEGNVTKRWQAKPLERHSRYLSTVQAYVREQVERIGAGFAAQYHLDDAHIAELEQKLADAKARRKGLKKRGKAKRTA